MSAKIDGRELIKQNEIHESTSGESSFIGLDDQNESEIKWIRLHQLFDK
tara:strand:- start:244 stop:390 length:147 start_codon:yes stop_codon:yes gene_type:complete